MDYIDYMNMDVDMDIWIYYIWKNKTYIRHIIILDTLYYKLYIQSVGYRSLIRSFILIH
jgi:hypothetical protein